jgi:hypothetical protein
VSSSRYSGVRLGPCRAVGQLTIERHADSLPHVGDPLDAHALPGSGGLLSVGQTLLHAEKPFGEMAARVVTQDCSISVRNGYWSDICVFLYVRAGCRRTYTQSGLGGQIRQLTDRRTTSPPIVEETQRSSDASLRQRLTLAHVRIRELDDENRHLRDQIAHLLGQLRANRIADSGVVADTVYNANTLIRLPNDQPDPR